MNVEKLLFQATSPRHAHAHSRLAWNRIADFWNQRMGEGNDFVDLLIWPCVERLIAPIDGRRVLDIACGNGLYARRLSQAGADVVAVDFAPGMIRAAIDGTPDGHAVEYRQLDVADPTQLESLCEDRFDAAVCLMALMDISDLRPLLAAIPALVPNGPFVFATAHPAFNSPHVERSEPFRPHTRPGGVPTHGEERSVSSQRS